MMRFIRTTHPIKRDRGTWSFQAEPPYTDANVYFIEWPVGGDHIAAITWVDSGRTSIYPETAQ